MDGDMTDPRTLFEMMIHVPDHASKSEQLTYEPGEIILEEAAPVHRMLILRHGDVAASAGGAHVCRYMPDLDKRAGAFPVLSAHDYCHSNGSSYTYVAETPVEILAIDTSAIIKMGLRDEVLALMRSLVLFSDMGVELRGKIADEFERTGLPCFRPDMPEKDILRYNLPLFGEFYLDFAMRTMAELKVGRIERSECPSTAIVAFKRPEWMTQGKSF